MWTAPQDGWSARTGNGWHSGTGDNWPDDTPAGTGWPQAAPGEIAPREGWPQDFPDETAPQTGWPQDFPADTAPQTSWPQAAPDSHRPGTGAGWPHDTPGHHRDGTIPEYPWPEAGTNWPDDTGTNWPDDTGTNWPDGTGGAANWPGTTGSSTHGPNGTGGSANGQSWIGSAWPNEASTAADSWPIAPGDAGPPSAPGDGWREGAASAAAGHGEVETTFRDTARSAAAWPDETGNRPEDQGPRPNGSDRAAGEQAAGEQTAGDRPADHELAGDQRLAMLCYLSVPFLGFLLPLAIYVLKRRKPGFVHGHAAQALNLALTAVLYTFCVLIVGTILALDTISVALLIGVPLVAALWIATLGYVVRAGAAASRGGYFRIPAWICATIAR